MTGRGALALVLAATSIGGCSSTSHVELGPLLSTIHADLGVRLMRAAPPPGIVLSSLRATYSGGTRDEQVTILEFFQAQDSAAVLGDGRVPEGVTVLHRDNVVLLYTHTGDPGHRRELQRALDRARLVSG